jgi:glycosyltransferase involved in cell wall biosynthesis
MNNVILYTDLDFFAGCESMIANFLNSKKFTKEYDSFLLFRKSPEYYQGLVKRVNNLSRVRSSGIIRIGRSQLPLLLRNNIFARACWRLVAITTTPIVYLFNIAVLFRILRETPRETLIINNGGYPGASSCLQAAYVARILGFKKVLMIVNNTAKPTIKLFRWFSNFYDRLIFESIDIVITGGEATKKALITAKNAIPEKIIVIPNGIDENRFKSSDIIFRRNKKFVNGQALTISIIGLHEERKGHLILLKSLDKLCKKRQELTENLTVYVEGEGYLTKSLMYYSEQVGISKIIKFMGNAVNISDLYASTDILVVPSLYSEDLPNVISEAMLFGIPTIGSKIAGIPSQIEHGENGFLFEPGDFNRLSAIIEEILENPALISMMSSKCVNKFYKKYDKDISTSRYMNIIGGL